MKGILAINPIIVIVVFLLYTPHYTLARKRKCAYRIHAVNTLNPIEAIGLGEELGGGEQSESGSGLVGPAPNPVPIASTSTSLRRAHHDVYLWPNLSNEEKGTIRDAFRQIHRRTCIRFNELDYKPWYHADRWRENKAYVVIRKSKRFSGYSDNLIEGIATRSLLYISEQALHNTLNVNQSRGMVMDQLLRFMGYREEYLRPDAPSYIQPTDSSAADVNSLVNRAQPIYSNEQLQWPFDPESITVPVRAREEFQLTLYCKARSNRDIGAGQRVGLLTRWDAVKLNSMYCPEQVGYADPRMGPCVVPRRKAG